MLPQQHDLTLEWKIQLVKDKDGGLTHTQDQPSDMKFSSNQFLTSLEGDIKAWPTTRITTLMRPRERT